MVFAQIKEFHILESMYPVFQNSSQWNPDHLFRIELSGRHYFESSCPNDVLYCVPLEPWVLFLLHKTVSKSVGRRFLITPGNIAIWHMFQYVGCLKSSTCTFWDILPPSLSACNSQKARVQDFLLACVCALPQERSSTSTLPVAPFFPFWNGCFQLAWSPENLKPALSKHNTHCVLNIGCTSHSLAWYNFCLWWAPNGGLQKPNFWNLSKTETEFWPPWRAAVSWILLQQCLKKPMATVLPTR